MKRLIVNADDFGLSPAVNRGIIEGYQTGIITSTTLMANMMGFPGAVAKARENPGLGVGVHLNLTWGKPVASDVRSLVGPEGTFYGSYKKFACKLYLGTISDDDIERELDAQIGKINRQKIPISHVDSHQHIFILPGVFRIVQRLMRKYGIYRLRLPMEKAALSSPGGGVSLLDRINKWGANVFCGRYKKKLQNEVIFCDFFYGITYLGKIYGPYLEELLNKLCDGVSEISCHPGYIDQNLVESGSKLIKSREKELHALTDKHCKELIKTNNIELISYHDL